MPNSGRRLGGCWPDAEQQLLLRAALLGGSDARAAWEAWQAAINVETIDEGSFRLLPLLYANLARLGVRSPLLPRLRGVHHQSWYKNQILFKSTATLLNQMNGAGIETLLLKGVPLAHLYYPDDATRPMSDADVLVKPHDVAATSEVLRQNGWRPKYDLRELPITYRRAWPFTNGDRSLDLHWRAFGFGPATDASLWNESMPFGVCGVRTRTLSAPAHALHAIVHGLQWSHVPPIRWIADVVMVLRQAGATFDWDQLFREAEQRKAMPTVAAGFRRFPLDLTTLLPPPILERVMSVRSNRMDRLAVWARTAPGFTSAACRVWLEYQQHLAEPGRSTSIGFLRYLRGVWMMGEEQSMAAAIAFRMKRRRDPRSVAKD